MMEHAALEGLTRLPHHVAIYVPTSNVTPAQLERELEYVQSMLAIEFGGYTTVPSRGGWVPENGHRVDEQVFVVTCYADELTEHKVDEVVRVAGNIKESMSQEVVAIVVDGTMYLV